MAQPPGKRYGDRWHQASLAIVASQDALLAPPAPWYFEPRSFSRGQNAFDLPKMVDVVSGDHADDELDGFLPAFRVLAILLPLLGRKRFEQREIRFAHHAVQFNGSAQIAF